MSVMRYTHDENNRRITFDSSPKYSICKTFGYNEESFDLRNGRKEGSCDVWDVYASQTEKKPRKVGKLEYLPPKWPGGEAQRWPSN